MSAFFTPTGYGTELARGKETREIDGRHYVLEYPIHADLALIKAERADRWGNLVYRKTARNFNPAMATAGKITVAEVEELVEPGQLDPDHIHTPGIYVQRWPMKPKRPAGCLRYSLSKVSQISCGPISLPLASAIFWITWLNSICRRRGNSRP